MSIRTLALIMILPTHAVAEAYGNVSGCARYLGSTAAPVTDVATYWDVGAGTLVFHETRCDVREVFQVGSGGVNLGVSCSGEGETWDTWYSLSSLSGDRYILSPEDYPSNETELSLCR